MFYHQDSIASLSVTGPLDAAMPFPGSLCYVGLLLVRVPSTGRNGEPVHDPEDSLICRPQSSCTIDVYAMDNKTGYCHC